VPLHIDNLVSRVRTDCEDADDHGWSEDQLDQLVELVRERLRRDRREEEQVADATRIVTDVHSTGSVE
jgi:regulator of sirC expression with transglutaminase-like and TPR domain